MTSDASIKFRQISIPCVTCLVAAACKDKEVTDEILSRKDYFEFLLGLEKWDESKKTYRKGLIEAWANLGYEIFSSMRTSEFLYMPASASPIFIHIMCDLADTLQYMVNTTSWRQGKAFDFDIEEIKRKLSIAITKKLE